MGLLRGMTYLESAPERVSYVSNALTVDDSRMVFLEQLSTPITLQSETGEITLRYFGISQSMTQLNDYFRCDAYKNNNSVYVLDSIIRQQAGQRSQTFTVSTNMQHENVLTDPNHLNQVLMNILSNAVKYTPTGGHIQIGRAHV